MESKPVKVLGRPAKTDAPFLGLGASPMLSSSKLKSIQSRDIKKKELCAEKGICLRVIKDLKSSKKEIEAGISIVLNDLFGRGD